ncbi:hypothetical protein [Jannaschia sp. M317]|uniref:hypothetical protein n=1 Tax=Jannaschia sp. M317 TaxID=2867011 RepID=UPI0021A2E15A|nr:hypothetical protein [Jannaschia sp. M317]UWQ17408.1 hypothetical protein K3551_16220 [Jannaschia sp. M317]
MSEDTDTALRGLAALEAGGWDAAHDIAQAGRGEACAWLHAHLHRVEGDAGNAAYWYARAGRAPFAGGVTEERGAMRAAFAR